MTTNPILQADPARARHTMIYAQLMLNQLAADSADDAFRAVEKEKTLYRFRVKQAAKALAAAINRYNDFTFRATHTEAEPLDAATNRLRSALQTDVARLFYTFKNDLDARRTPHAYTLAATATAFTLSRIALQLFTQIDGTGLFRGYSLRRISPRPIQQTLDGLLHTLQRTTGLTGDFSRIPHLETAVLAIQNKLYSAQLHQHIMSNN